MTTEKLIDDAVQAFEDREITAPSRGHLRVALDAFDASLTKCGCEACTIARRERIAITDHDRTTVARALHEIVYSPGANFDRAVPGVQEYMLERAEKVVAALPWIVPTPEVEVALDEFAPGECDGSGTCPAPHHIHGCYTTHRADQCDAPEEYGHLPADTQGESSDAHLSNVSINGVRQTWQQLYESEHEAHVALQGYRRLLSDLDRNAGGRHEGDYDSFASDNGGISAGNPHLTTGQIIGYDIGGREYVVPEPRERGTLSAWVRAGGVR